MKSMMTAWWAVLLLALGGCSSLRVPRIDPTGERIFLPADPTAPGAQPQRLLPQCDWSKWTPSFKRPERPLPGSVLTGPPGGLPCERPPQHGPCGPNTPGSASCLAPLQYGKGVGNTLYDRVRHHMHKNGCETVVPRGVPGSVCLTPQTLVAPVGREVVLVAGMCGADGYLITEQPMEWMLSQESVGHFVDVGEPAPSWFKRVNCREGQKLGVDYAITKTTDKRTMITRGTPSTRDDVLLKRGQTWVSLTSPSEGTSYVTTLATDGDRWDQRRRTATIHWVDADIAFPSSQQLERGQRAELVTSVVRASDRIPAEGWIVIYTIADGVSARLIPEENGQLVRGSDQGTQVEMRTDKDGEARIFVEHVEGATANDVPVQIEVVRPMRGAAPRLPVAQKTIAINWAAAGLSVRCEGSRTVVEGGMASYRFTIANPGNLMARNVRVQAQIPDAFELQNSNPPPVSVMSNIRTFELGDIEPGGIRTIDINALVRPGFAGQPVRVDVAASGEPGLAAKAPGCRTEIVAQSLRVTMTPVQQGPVEVGQMASYEVLVENVGPTMLENVSVRADFPPQLQERHGWSSPIERAINEGSLAPGTRAEPFFITYLPLQPGEFRHQITVTANGGHAASTTDVVQATAPEVRPPEAKVEIQKTGPQQINVGSAIDYEITVRNVGDLPIENVQIADRYPPSMTPLYATRGWAEVPGANEIRWKLDRLEVGQSLLFRVRARADKADPRAVNQAVIFGEVGGQNIQESFDFTTEIVGGPVPQPQPGGQPQPGAQPGAQPQPGPGAAAEPLNVTLDTLGVTPVRFGERVNFYAVIENLQAVSDRNVVLRLYVPPGLAQPQFKTPPPLQVRSLGDGTYVFDPITELRANESLKESPFYFNFAPRQPGDYTLRIEVTSQNSPQAIVREQRVTVQ